MEMQIPVGIPIGTRVYVGILLSGRREVDNTILIQSVHDYVLFCDKRNNKITLTRTQGESKKVVRKIATFSQTSILIQHYNIMFTLRVCSVTEV